MAASFPRHSAGTANTANVVTLSTTQTPQLLAYIEPSYDLTPTGGALTITYNGVTVYRTLISNAGPGPRATDFIVPPNTTVVLTLAAAGAGVTGVLNYGIGGV